MYVCREQPATATAAGLPLHHQLRLPPTTRGVRPKEECVCGGSVGCVSLHRPRGSASFCRQRDFRLKQPVLLRLVKQRQGNCYAIFHRPKVLCHFLFRRHPKDHPAHTLGHACESCRRYHRHFATQHQSTAAAENAMHWLGTRGESRRTHGGCRQTHAVLLAQHPPPSRLLNHLWWSNLVRVGVATHQQPRPEHSLRER
jgi:hypothetical protein